MQPPVVPVCTGPFGGLLSSAQIGRRHTKTPPVSFQSLGVRQAVWKMPCPPETNQRELTGRQWLQKPMS